MCSLPELKIEYPDVPAELWKMLNSLDAFTYNHSIRVCELCRVVEKEMKIDGKILSEAGLLHDIGKYYISSNILEKKGALTETERYVINAHAFLSYYTLLRFSVPEIICEVALYHHSTSPSLFDRALPPCKDENVRKLSIILKTIDIFEAITSDRPYHRGLSVASSVKTFADVEHDPEALKILENTNISYRS